MFALPPPFPLHLHLQYSQSFRSSSATLDPQADPRYRYQLIQKIGEGGYGSVYRAFDAHTGQTVAVKTIDLEGAAFSCSCTVHSFTFDWCCMSRPRVSPVGVVGVGDELDEVNQEIAVMSEVRACVPALTWGDHCRLLPVPIEPLLLFRRFLNLAAHRCIRRSCLGPCYGPFIQPPSHMFSHPASLLPPNAPATAPAPAPAYRCIARS